MAVESAQVSVGTTATALNTAGNSGQKLVVRNPSTTVTVFLGPSGVTTANGFEVGTEQTVTVETQAGEALFGVVAAGTEPVHVLRTGV